MAGDIGVDAAKTGMLASAAIVEAVAESAAEMSLPNIVVDPVFVSKHGHPLLADDAVDALRRSILPLATLVTPNLAEAAGLAGLDVVSRDDMRRAATTILALGPRAVLVKEGTSRAIARPTCSSTERENGSRPTDPDAEYPRYRLHVVRCDRRASGSRGAARRRGSGGKAFVTEAIRHALPLGDGIGPVDQLWSIGVAQKGPEAR